MAITSGTKINFYNTNYATFAANQANVKDGSLFFLNDGSAGHGGRIYSGTNLVANVGFEEFSLTKSGSGSYITDITPTSFVADDGTLTVGLTLSTGTPDAAKNNYATVKIAAASTAVTNQAGGSSAVTVGPNTTSDTLTFTPGNKWITLYGTANDDSIKVSHLVGTISGGSANTVYGPSTAVTQTAGTSKEIMVPQLKVDEAGHVTQVNHFKLTVVDSANTDKAKGYFGTKSSNDVSLHIGPNATASADGTDGHGVTFTQGTQITLTRDNDAKLMIAHEEINTAVEQGAETVTVLPGQSKTIDWLDNFSTTVNGHVSSYTPRTFTVDLTGLSSAIHWKGSVSTLPSRPSSGWVAYEAGDVIAVGNKEYILDNESSTGTSGWREFGNEGDYVPTTRKVLGEGPYLTQSSSGVLSSDVTISHKTLLTTGTSDTNYGSDTKVPQIKVDAAGHVTSISNVDITHPEGFGAIDLINNDTSTNQLTSANSVINATTSADEMILESANKWLHLAGGSNSEDLPVIYIAHDASGSTTVTKVDGIGVTPGGTINTFEVITDISTDAAKHVTYIEKKPISIISDNADNAYVVANSATATQANLTANSTANGAWINVWSDQTAANTTVANKHSIKLYGVRDVSVSAEKDGIISIGHSNTVTANTTDGWKTFAFDAHGHITAATTKTATTFTVKADSTSVAAQTDFGTAQELKFQKPSTAAADATKLKISGTGSSTGVTYDFGPVWQTL